MSLKNTPLLDEHKNHGGKIIEFAGYRLPISYSSINHEHNIVRNHVGVFDVSHMGEFLISGNDAFAFLQKLTTNDLGKLQVGQAQYSVMCYEDGGIIDDLIIYKKRDEYMMVINASNREKDLEWLKKHQKGDVFIEDISDHMGLLAVQGPKSRDLFRKISNHNINSLKFYHFCYVSINGIDLMISRTGYTGELGYELYVKSDKLVELWKYIINEGKNLGIEPVGLGCRDTLRMEMNYLLYGSDINEKTNPIEAGLKWITKFEEKEFIGKNNLKKLYKTPFKKLICIEMKERAIPRNGNSIYYNNDLIGEVTSGTMSPSLKKGICLGYIYSKQSQIGTNLLIDIRGKKKKGCIVDPPFYKNGSLMN